MLLADLILFVLVAGAIDVIAAGLLRWLVATRRIGRAGTALVGCAIVVSVVAAVVALVRHRAVGSVWEVDASHKASALAAAIHDVMQAEVVSLGAAVLGLVLCIAIAVATRHAREPLPQARSIRGVRQSPSGPSVKPHRI